MSGRGETAKEECEMIVLFSLLLDVGILTALWASDISVLQKAAASVFLFKYEIDQLRLREN